MNKEDMIIEEDIYEWYEPKVDSKKKNRKERENEYEMD